MAGLTVNIDSASLDEALEKAERLNAALREAKSLIHDLTFPVTLSAFRLTGGLDLGVKGGDRTVYAEINTERR